LSKVLIRRVAFGTAVLRFLLNLGVHVATFVIRPGTAEYFHDLNWSFILISLLAIAVLLLALLVVPKDWLERDRKRKLRESLLRTGAPRSVRLLYLLAVLLLLYGAYLGLFQVISLFGSFTGEPVVTGGSNLQIQGIRSMSAIWMDLFLIQALNIAE